ncbi:MAG TPA: hypothetical protein VNX02_06900 [Steroidobacteraceae bacterium]|jgi:hypothetical protein|nr:hypothetical protein [Steroidobacteraceae bacterium]
MKHMPRIWKVGAVGLLALAGLAGCVAGGYDGEVGVGYVGGFYEPGGYEYGGWGPGYRVGPPRGGERGPGRRAAPSIPHAARGGGHRGGGNGH